MSRDYGGWAPYVPVAERRRKAARAAARLRKQGRVLAPVTIAGRTIATTFWGRAWCDNMESYRDFESRLPRGRTYVRNGSVLDLQITPGQVTALVNGSELYRIAISIKQVPAAAWRRICTDCAGRIESLVELLQGMFSKSVMERLCRQENGLFPRPSDIRFACSCQDHASMCKHVAAVLYGVGARLDHKPELLFRLRAVDETELVAGIGTELPIAKAAPAAGKVLHADDVAALFGLDMAAAAPAAEQQGRKPRPPRAGDTRVTSTPTPHAPRPRIREAREGGRREGRREADAEGVQEGRGEGRIRRRPIDGQDQSRKAGEGRKAARRRGWRRSARNGSGQTPQVGAAFDGTAPSTAGRKPPYLTTRACSSR